MMQHLSKGTTQIVQCPRASVVAILTVVI
jgi:hypothetical protein